MHTILRAIITRVSVILNIIKSLITVVATYNIPATSAVKIDMKVMRSLSTCSAWRKFSQTSRNFISSNVGLGIFVAPCRPPLRR